MIGDSITDTGRARPIGEGSSDALGRGYVCLVDAFLRTAYPERRIRVVNVGTSGNTIRDLKERWQTDVFEQSPDWLSIMIGINDVWRQFDRPLQTEAHVYPEEYEATLEEIVDQTLPRVKGVVLMTPYYMELNTKDAMRSRMDEYGAVVRRTAEKYDTLFVDLQAAFAPVLEHYYPASLGWDRVHPDQAGHMIIAQAFLKAVGFPM
jgi:lysophospholipase L1-like esterase